MQLSNAYETVYNVILIVIAVMIFLCLIRAIIGPKVTDRIVSMNMIGTLVIAEIAILALKLNQGYLVDICLIYAMISFLAVIILAKVFMGMYQEQKEKGGKNDVN